MEADIKCDHDEKRYSHQNSKPESTDSNSKQEKDITKPKKPIKTNLAKRNGQPRITCNTQHSVSS